MKRLMMVLAVVLAGFMAISAGNRGTATSDDIPVLQTQVADLDARVTSLEALTSIKPIGTPAAIDPAMSFSGDGDQIVDVGTFEEGVYIVSMTTIGESGSSPKAVVTALSNGEHLYLLGPAEAPFAIQAVWSVYSTDRFLFEIDSQVPWTITIERVS